MKFIFGLYYFVKLQYITMQFNPKIQKIWNRKTDIDQIDPKKGQKRTMKYFNQDFYIEL